MAHEPGRGVGVPSAPHRVAVVARRVLHLRPRLADVAPAPRRAGCASGFRACGRSGAGGTRPSSVRETAPRRSRGSVAPPRTAAATRSSCGVSARPGAAPAGTRCAQLALRLRRPRGRAEPLEAGLRLAQAVAGVRAPAGAMQPAPVGEQRARALERHRPAIVERERIGERRVEVSSSMPRQRAAAAPANALPVARAWRSSVASTRRASSSAPLRTYASIRSAPTARSSGPRGRSPRGAARRLELGDRLVDAAERQLQEPERCVHEAHAAS